VREGGALLQGLAICGNCGRKLRTHYTGRTASPGYHCPGRNVAEGRGRYCLNVGAMQIGINVTLSHPRFCSFVALVDEYFPRRSRSRWRLRSAAGELSLICGKPSSRAFTPSECHNCFAAAGYDAI
jgi:hypothetical protein